MRTALSLAALVLAATPALADPQPWEGGDAAKGKEVATKCQLCHYLEPNKVKLGPPLWGVVGRPSGSVPGYTYSAAMKAYNHVWTPENLYIYLEHPMQVVKGTKMTFAGLASPDDRKNVIAYLETLK